MNETRRLAEYVVNFRLEDCPAEVVHQAKRCTVETVACALGGSRTPLAQAAVRALDRMGDGGPCTVFGLGRRAAPDRAAFVNGVAANALDYDGGVVLQGHYGGTVIFATMAMAELAGATGREFVEAVIAAYEVTTRIGEATRPSPEHRRLVSGYGPHQGFAAVVAAGRLLKLDVERMIHAFGIYGAFAPLPSSAQWNWRNRPLTWTKDMVGVAVGVRHQRGAARGIRLPRSAHDSRRRARVLADGGVGPLRSGGHARRARRRASTSCGCTSRRIRRAAGTRRRWTACARSWRGAAGGARRGGGRSRRRAGAGRPAVRGLPAAQPRAMRSSACRTRSR